MRKSQIKLLLVVGALMLSTTVSAVGMGGINVSSALGQPLKADIELVAVTKAEKSSLVARIASPEAYKSAGLEYPFGNKFKFQVESRTDGEPYLKVSSVQPINDPFVTILVELTWSSGKLLREYTFLLDPPGYVPEQPAQAVVQAVAPAVQIAASGASAALAEAETASGVPVTPAETALGVPPASLETPATSGVPAAPTEATTASGVPSAPAEAAAKPAIAAPVTGGVTTGSLVVQPNKEWLVVHPGDTMTKIAEQYKLADISLERMLIALYRANVDEFEGKNINRIRAGKILRLPKPEDAENVTQTEAKREIRAQAADWNAYRQQLASTAAISREPEAVQQIATGKISSTVADKAPVAKESAREVLKLSKGEAPGDQVATGAGGTPASAQDRKNAAQEDTIAKAKAAKEEQMRTAMLEQNMKAMEELAKLKAELAQAQAKVQAPTPAPVTAVPKFVMASPAAAASAVPAASAVNVAKSKPKEVTEPSLVDQLLALLDQILGQPLYLAGGVVALLVVGGLGFMSRRPGGLGALFAIFKSRKKKSSFDIGAEDSDGISEDIGSTSGRITAPVSPSPDTGDFTRPPVAQAEAAASQTDNVDPISEADLFLNFGRDAQAEEILKEALKNTPNNHQIHLKLLGIYSNRKDTSAFAAIASELKDSGDEYAWQEATAMGRELDPGNPLYGGSGGMGDSGTTQMAALASAGSPVAPPSGLDFDFDLGALSGKAAPSPEQDFLNDASKTVIMSAGDMATIQQPSTMDFDVTSAAASEPTKVPNLDELIFDVTGSHAAMPAAQPEASKPAVTAHADDGVMEFTMDFPVKAAAKPAPAAQAAEADLAAISLDLGEFTTSAVSAAGGKDDRWHEVATKLDLAKAYQEMGDADGVREILAEVLNEGDTEQQDAAKGMLKQLG